MTGGVSKLDIDAADVARCAQPSSACFDVLAEMENQQRISPTANMWMGLSDRSSRWRAPSTLAGERCWKRGKLRSGGRCRRGTKSQTCSSKQIAVARTRTV
jgi:hypothetical protein